MPYRRDNDTVQSALRPAPVGLPVAHVGQFTLFLDASDPQIHDLVAMAGGAYAGYLSLDLHSASLPGPTVGYIYVDRAFAKQGLSEIIFREALNHYSPIYSDDKQGEWAANMWRRFAASEQFKVSVLKANGAEVALAQHDPWENPEARLVLRP